jgi:hypothetical protein
MAKVIEPLRQEKKLYQVIQEEKPKKVLLFFWHGLGDLIMFMKPLEAFKDLFPDVQIDLGIVQGIGQDEIYPEAIGFTGDTGKDENLATLDYDIVAKIHFPMNEHQEEYTKGEWCCIHELGIAPVSGHKLNFCPPHALISPFVAVHFNITCLPDSANPDKDTAKAIWEEIIEAGLIPIECHFEHVFHNPTNAKFDFIDCTVRGVRPQVSSLIGLLRASRFFIGVVSGPFHTALSVMAPNKIMLLEKDFKLKSFTKIPISTTDIKNYKKGDILKWIKHTQAI